MTPLQSTRLEKAAVDCGFELTPLWEGNVLTMRSARFPESVVVEVLPDDMFRVTPSLAVLFPPDRPDITNGWSALYVLLDTASSRALNLPNRVAQRFQLQVDKLPKSTEAERLVVQRVGQSLFRDALLNYWQGRCCVTGLAITALLRASHIRPWSQCESDEQRLDVFNGLLLSPNMDAAFDGGLISFEDNGVLFCSERLSKSDQVIMGIEPGQRIQGFSAEHFKYLRYHRENVFMT